MRLRRRCSASLLDASDGAERRAFLSQPLIPSAIVPVGPTVVFPLTVNGTGFVPGAAVNWNGSPQPTFFVDNSQLVARILYSEVAKSTTAWITVVNPGPGGGISNTLYLPVSRPISQFSFRRRDYPVGNLPAFPTAVDLYGNGILDLAVPTNNFGEVLFLTGKGDGTFRYGDSYPVGYGTDKPQFGDFNRDGILDMAIPQQSPSAIAVLLGRANATFKSPVYYPVAGLPVWDIIADFNGDGMLDMATANQLADNVSILLGNGDGSFQPHVDYPAGFSTALAAGDFNRDGALDLAVSIYDSDTVAVRAGNGDGTFRQHIDESRRRFLSRRGCGRGLQRRRRAGPRGGESVRGHRLGAAGQWGWHLPSADEVSDKW